MGENRVKTVDDDLRMSKLQGTNYSADQIKTVRQEHKKFMDLIRLKHDHLKPIIYWLSNSNINAAVNAIEK